MKVELFNLLTENEIIIHYNFARNGFQSVAEKAEIYLILFRNVNRRLIKDITELFSFSNQFQKK